MLRFSYRKYSVDSDIHRVLLINAKSNQIKTKPDLASTHLLYPRPMIKSLLVSWRKHSSSKGLPKIT